MNINKAFFFSFFLFFSRFIFLFFKILFPPLFFNGPFIISLTVRCSRQQPLTAVGLSQRGWGREAGRERSGAHPQVHCCCSSVAFLLPQFSFARSLASQRSGGRRRRRTTTTTRSIWTKNEREKLQLNFFLLARALLLSCSENSNPCKSFFFFWLMERCWWWCHFFIAWRDLCVCVCVFCSVDRISCFLAWDLLLLDLSLSGLLHVWFLLNCGNFCNWRRKNQSDWFPLCWLSVLPWSLPLVPCVCLCVCVWDFLLLLPRLLWLLVGRFVGSWKAVELQGSPTRNEWMVPQAFVIQHTPALKRVCAHGRRRRRHGCKFFLWLRLVWVRELELELDLSPKSHHTQR